MTPPLAARPMVAVNCRSERMRSFNWRASSSAQSREASASSACYNSDRSR
jgi:hypothetical protein